MIYYSYKDKGNLSVQKLFLYALNKNYIKILYFNARR